MSTMKMRTFFQNFFSPDIASRELNEEIKAQRNRIQNLKIEYQSLSRWHQEYVSTLSLLTDAMDAMIWKKDSEHKYLLANPLHCERFFGFDPSYECLGNLIGKTDEELIDANFSQRGLINTFPPTCKISDDYTRDKKVIVHFLEAGVINGKEILLYAVKTPQYSDRGDFEGTIGMGWDMTSKSEFLVKQLNRWIYAEKATRLFHEKDVFSYAIVPEVKQCAIFNHVCPVPERGSTCDGRCSVCKVRKKDEKNDSVEHRL